MNEITERCELKTGDCIKGKYTIEKTLGEGTFGKVFKVREKSGGRNHALKLFKFWEIQARERESMFERFKMEYDTGQIRSKYLVNSIERGTIKGNPFIVMEFCPDGDLMKYVTENPKIDFIKIGREILYGLKDLHQNGKVHRDLKPENVLMKKDGTAALTDFGISGDRKKRITVTDWLGKPKEIFGTYFYMAPEQANPKNREVTVLPTMDIFAFGVMMYNLITDASAFGPLYTDNDLPVYLNNVKNGNWNKDPLLKCSEGKKLESVISGCLIPDFKQRLQNVDAVLELFPKNEKYNYQNSAITIQKDIVEGILLRIMQGEEHGIVYKLKDLLKSSSKIITIGCKDPSVSNILPIQEHLTRYISRKHCTLELFANNKWFIRDGQWDKQEPNGWKRSLNGTFVNSTEVSYEGMPIKPGDIITIGEVKMRVEGY